MDGMGIKPLLVEGEFVNAGGVGYVGKSHGSHLGKV